MRTIGYDLPVLRPDPEPPLAPSPVADVPALVVKWEGLVVTVDATTLNTIVHRATASIPEIRQIQIELENGVFALAIRLKKGIPVPLRARVGSIRFRDGFLGFTIQNATAFGCVRVPRWVFRKIAAAQPPGRAFWYPADRVFVVNLGSLLPSELTLQVTRVVCENGEIRLHFGPSHYRLDRLVDEIGRE